MVPATCVELICPDDLSPADAPSLSWDPNSGLEFREPALLVQGPARGRISSPRASEGRDDSSEWPSDFITYGSCGSPLVTQATDFTTDPKLQQDVALSSSSGLDNAVVLGGSTGYSDKRGSCGIVALCIKNVRKACF